MDTRTILAGLSLALLSRCATIIRGTEQEVAVNTNPAGATVQFSNGQSCTSPCRIKSRRDQSLIITITKDAYATQTATMMPMLAGGGVMLGGLIDYGTGGRLRSATQSTNHHTRTTDSASGAVRGY
jgi:hypothetical protein